MFSILKCRLITICLWVTVFAYAASVVMLSGCATFKEPAVQTLATKIAAQSAAYFAVKDNPKLAPELEAANLILKARIGEGVTDPQAIRNALASVSSDAKIILATALDVYDALASSDPEKAKPYLVGLQQGIEQGLWFAESGATESQVRAEMRKG